MNKKVSTFLLLSLLAIGACGKRNESGKSQNAWGFNNPYGSPLMNPYGTNLPSFGGVNLGQVFQHNPCIGGYGGYMGQMGTMNYNNQRIPIQVPMVNFPGVIGPNDVYVGVTSYGDVATVVGRPPGQPPLFVGYMCPRSFSPQGGGQLMDVKIGAYTQCIFKPITAAIVAFPGGATANFRMLDGGTSIGFMNQTFQKFPPPICR